MPRPMPAARAMGSERMLATAAAVRPATSRAVNCSGSVGLSDAVSGSRSTPARPARALDRAHAPAATRGALIPSSWAMRRLSTTARICSPMSVQRNMATTAATTTTVITVVVTSPPLIGRREDVEVDVVGVQPQVGRVQSLAVAEEDRQRLGDGDEQAQRRHQLGRGRGGGDVAEQEPVEGQAEQRGDHQHRQDEGDAHRAGGWFAPAGRR